MPRLCGPCKDLRRDEIDERLKAMPSSRETFRGLAREYGHSEDSLARHCRSHLESQGQDEEGEGEDIRGFMIRARMDAFKEAGIKPTIETTSETSDDSDNRHKIARKSPKLSPCGGGGVLSTGVRETSDDSDSAKCPRYPRNVRETSDDSGINSEKSTDSDPIKLEVPGDIMGYIQKIINQVQSKGLEIDSRYVGKITSLLTTWLVAYKTNLESIEIQQLREEINELRSQIEVSNGYGRRLQNP